MGGRILVCKHCAALLTGPLEPWTLADWENEAYRVFTFRSPLVDEHHVLRWANELWTDDNLYLPFATDSWVIAPEALVIKSWVTTPHGCCGYPPCPSKSDNGFKYYSGSSPMNQQCSCGVLIGWHNTDCLLPCFIAFSNEDVDALEE